jgi:nucleotide-binding universal stress UspA family protein
MKILCATDFSDAAGIAARAAAALAKHLGTPLHLVHAAHLPGTSPATKAATFQLAEQELDRRRYLLHWQAESLRQTGCEVVEHVREGLPDEELLAESDALGADLVVIGPRGERKSFAFSLGSVAMRTIKSSRAPVLVVRDERPILAWIAKERPLRAVIGVDASQTSDAALAWAKRLSDIGPAETVAAHVYSPADVRARHRLAHYLDPNVDVAKLEEAVANELRERVAATAPGVAATLRVATGWGRVAHHLIEMATRERADLVVIGTHRRRGLDRIWHGSVAVDIVANAHGNVLVVPSEAARARAPEPGRHALEIRRVLVPCDLSENSSRAIEWACALLARGGTLQLIHVATPFVPLVPDFGGYMALPPSPEELTKQSSAIEAEMRALVPSDLAARGIDVHTEIATGFQSADTIVDAATRLESDAICMTTHGRSGISRALLGSVAESVLRHAHVPVFVVTPPRPERASR